MYQKKFYLSILFSLFFAYANAAIIYVDNNVNPHPTGNDGTSWLKAYTSLATALSNANYGDIIRMDQGVYTAPSGGFILKDGVKIYGGYNVRYNSGTIIPEWLINSTRFFGSPPATTTIEGTTCFLANQDLDNQSVLDGLIIKNNSNSSSSYGIEVFNSTQFDMIVNNCTFESYLLTNSSVGIATTGNFFSGSFNPKINNCIFELHKGIDALFTGSVSINIDINNTTFRNNDRAVVLVGSQTSSGNSIINIKNSLLSSQKSDLVHVLDNINSSINIENSIFGSTSNQSIALLNSNASLKIDNSTFYNKKALRSHSTLPAYFNNCLFADVQQVID